MQLNPMQMLQQVLKAPNKEQIVMNMINSNPQANNMFNQLKGMSREAQAQKIADICNQKGITLEQIRNLLR